MIFIDNTFYKTSLSRNVPATRGCCIRQAMLEKCDCFFFMSILSIYFCALCITSKRFRVYNMHVLFLWICMVRSKEPNKNRPEITCKPLRRRAAKTLTIEFALFQTSRLLFHLGQLPNVGEFFWSRILTEKCT